ncbi:MAG: histone, partial [Phycisphaerae bacterium]|nr:histone [Phycisphaerae bacterium]
SSIKAGKIKGKDAKADDTIENLLAFIKSVGKKMFPKKFRYTRVKDPEKPGKKRSAAKKAPAKKAPAKKAPAKKTA